MDSREYLVLLGWILKDLGWVTLCAPLAWPAAMTALYAEVTFLSSRWKQSSAGFKAHGFADVCWLVGNVIWMSDEFLFEEPGGAGRRSPWYNGPMFTASTERYDSGVNVCRAVLMFGLASLVGFYSLCGLDVFRLEDECDASDKGTRSSRVWGFVPVPLYSQMFIGPWIAKDLAWTWEVRAPLAFFAIVTIFVSFDCLRRFGGNHFLAELLWIVGNCVWAFGEVVVQDEFRWPRVVAATLLLCAGLALAADRNFRQLVCALSGGGGETKPLLIGKAVPKSDAPAEPSLNSWGASTFVASPDERRQQLVI